MFAVYSTTGIWSKSARCPAQPTIVPLLHTRPGFCGEKTIETDASTFALWPFVRVMLPVRWNDATIRFDDVTILAGCTTPR
jgi:hypothetical protein